MPTKKQSLEKLNRIMCSNAPNTDSMLFRNTFALACSLSIEGKREASNKLLISLFDHLGWDQRKNYFIAIRESIHEFAFEYMTEINANAELNRLG